MTEHKTYSESLKIEFHSEQQIHDLLEDFRRILDLAVPSDLLSNTELREWNMLTNRYDWLMK